LGIVSRYSKVEPTLTIAGTVSCIGSGGAVFVACALWSGVAVRITPVTKKIAIKRMREAKNVNMQVDCSDLEVSMVLLQFRKISHSSATRSECPWFSTVREPG